MPSIRGQYDQLTELNPKPIVNFVPSNAAEQKQLFLAGEVRNPVHEYDRLNTLNLEEQKAKIETSGLAVLSHEFLTNKTAPAYEQIVEDYTKKLEFIQLARDFNNESNEEAKELIKARYMELNVELFGEPKEGVYRSLVKAALEQIDARDLSAEEKAIREELDTLLPAANEHITEPIFQPSEETVQWMHEVAKALYGGMLRHIPEDKETFDVDEVKAIFETILSEEFEGAADDWEVVIAKAPSINVVTSEKKIIIPIDRAAMDAQELRLKVVHEIGVHVLRSITGEQTETLPLIHGLADYYTSEEGIGKVMEQALANQYKVEGQDYYIAAGAIYFDNKDFRDTQEILWRLQALRTGSSEGNLEETIEKAKNYGYRVTHRITRGTDELPWFKDLGYYNGIQSMWKYLESIRGDDTKFMFFLQGKTDPSNIEDERIVYEAKSL